MQGPLVKGAVKEWGGFGTIPAPRAVDMPYFNMSFEQLFSRIGNGSWTSPPIRPMEKDTGGMLIDIAHLIEHKSIEKYQNRFNSATTQLKGCEVVISGPWPPYHFMPGKLRTVVGNS